MMARRLQHWASIISALVHQYISLNAINVQPMLDLFWPIVYGNGSAVKQHWLNISFLSPATRYTDTMLVQCWNSVINDGTTFNQHVIGSVDCLEPA